MRKAIKNLALALLSVTFFIMATVGILTNGNIQSAMAEANPVAVENNFVIKNGASIRITKGQPSGIRWAVSVTEEFHRYVSALGTPTYYTLVNKAPIVEEGENVDALAIKCTGTPKFDKNGVWTFNASIVYDQLSAELKDSGYGQSEIEQLLVKAYETELFARAYVEIETTEDKQIIFSQAGDTARSIKNVATYCLINGEVDADNKSTFENIAGKQISVENTETQKSMKVESIYAEKQPDGANLVEYGAGKVVSQEELPAGNYDVLVGAKYLTTIAHAGGVATANIRGLASDMYQAGEDYYANFVKEDGKVYQIPFRYATAVLDEGADFNIFAISKARHESKWTLGGYYIMSKDVAGGPVGEAGFGYSGINVYSPANAGFAGVLDGNGFAIRNANLPHGGIFDAVEGGTIKNFAIIDCNLFSFGEQALAIQLNGATLDNVLVNVHYTFDKEIKRNPSVFAISDVDTTFSNCLFKTNYTPYKDQADLAGAYGLVDGSGVDYMNYTHATSVNPYVPKYSKMLEKSENVYYVSANTYIMGHNANKRWYGANEVEEFNGNDIEAKFKKLITGIYHYKTDAELGTALTELPAGFNADLWKLDANGLAWK